LVILENLSATDGQVTSIGFRNNNSIGTTSLIDSVAVDHSTGATDLRFSTYSGSAWNDNMLVLSNTGNVEISKDLVLGTDSSIVLDDLPLDNTSSGSGTIVNWSVSSATTAGQVYSIKADGGWATVMSSGFQATLMLGWSLGTNSTQGILLQGFLYKASHGLTIGAPIYIGGSQGALTNTAPTTTGHFVRIIGYATSLDNIYFDPDKTWVELT